MLGKRAYRVDDLDLTHRGARYTFHVDGIQEGTAYLSPVIETQSETPDETAEI